MAKGIRVSALAKELGYPSKEIVDRCKAEGLPIISHTAVLTAGQEMTLRGWFPRQSEGGGVATAEAPPETALETEEAPAKVKRPSRSRGRKKPDEVSLEAEDQAAHEAEVPAAPPLVEAPVQTPNVAESPVRQTPEVVVAEPGVTQPAATLEPPTPSSAEPVIGATAPQVGASGGAAVIAPPGEQTPAAATSHEIAAKTAEAPPGAAHVAPPRGRGGRASGGAGAAAASHGGAATAPITNRGGDGRSAVSRPTIRLDDRHPAPAQPPRQTVTPAPQLKELEPVKMQGPRVVREEKPDLLPAPGPRRPARGGDGAAGPGFTTARPQTGRGVRIVEDEEEGEQRRGGAAGGKSGARSNSRRRGGINGRSGEALEKLREFSEQDLADRRRRINESARHRTEFDKHIDKAGQRGTHAIAKTTVQKGEPVEIEPPITVRSLASVLGVKGNDIISRLMKQGVFATINEALESEVAETIALEYGLELRVKQPVTQEELLEHEFADRPSDEANLVTRPPVVTILGHVDHGKTSLLDKIRHANVAAGEAGGITQHTAAWMVMLGEGEGAKRVTFVDTPGHQAFTSMRARGANMTDVVVLVVSAAEGVQPQTVESINHARAAEVPIVVAMNKIDRADANPDMVLGQLAAQGLNPVEWGGDTEVVRTSAITGQGVPELIEILDYQSQLLELKADPTAPARGTVIESSVDPGLGPVPTVLVQDGTLRVGDVMLSGPGYGRIRTLLNDRRQSIGEAGPSTPVIVSGLDQLPLAGDKFYVVDNLDRARTIAEERQNYQRQASLAQRSKVTLDNLFETMKEGEVKTINLIIKGDVQGSVETLSRTVTDANTDEVKVRVIHAAVGGITESDVELADASNAVIIGFHVVPDESARTMAEQRRVEVRLYSVIYDIFDDLKKALSGMLEPEIREKLHGHAEIRQVIKVSKIGNVAGCMVTDGHIQRGSRIRLTRGGSVVAQDLAIGSLRRVKEDVREVKAGLECGIKLDGYDDVKVGDILEAYVRETFQRTL